MKKVSLYKFTYIPLLINDTQLKQKSDKQPKKISNHLNLLKNKNHVQKQKITSKQKTKNKKKKKAKEKIYIYI